MARVVEERDLDVAARRVEGPVARGVLLEGHVPLGFEVDRVDGDEARQRIVEDGRLDQVLDAVVGLLGDEGVDLLATLGAHPGEADVGVEGVAGKGAEALGQGESGLDPERIGELERDVVVRGAFEVRARLAERRGDGVGLGRLDAAELQREGHALCRVAARAGLEHREKIRHAPWRQHDVFVRLRGRNRRAVKTGREVGLPPRRWRGCASGRGGGRRRGNDERRCAANEGRAAGANEGCRYAANGGRAATRRE